MRKKPFFVKLSYLKNTVDSWVNGWYKRIRYQWFTPYKLITVTTLKKGEYRDLDEIIFQTVFQLLINYVENEESGIAKRVYVSQYIDYLKGKCKWNDLSVGAKQYTIAEYARASIWNKIINKKDWNSKLGVAALLATLFELQEWNAKVKNKEQNKEELSWSEEFEYTHQKSAGKNDKEILKLYKWYKFDRPHRQDPFLVYKEPSELYIDKEGRITNSMFENKETRGTVKMNSFTKEYSDYLRKVGDLEEKYYQEDTEMAKRVIEIRRYLWT